MKPAPFFYHAPTNLDERRRLLAKFGDEAALLAGGQNLVPLMRFRLARPANVDRSQPSVVRCLPFGALTTASPSEHP